MNGKWDEYVVVWQREERLGCRWVCDDVRENKEMQSINSSSDSDSGGDDVMCENKVTIIL